MGEDKAQQMIKNEETDTYTSMYAGFWAQKIDRSAYFHWRVKFAMFKFWNLGLIFPVDCDRILNDM